MKTLPTSNRAEKLLEECKRHCLNIEDTVQFISYALADKEDRVHIDKKDLEGLIINIINSYDIKL